MSPEEKLITQDHEDFPVTSLAINETVDRAEAAMIASAKSGAPILTAENFPVENYFAPGLYARSLFRAKGTLIIGHAHRHAHLSIVLQGRLRVFVNGRVREIVGPSKPFLTEAGTRKATLALEDTTLITFHATQETDLGRLENELIEKSPEFLAFEEERMADLLRQDPHAEDREDYRLFLAEINLDHKQVFMLMSNESDMIAQPECDADSICIRPSTIHGLGVFARRKFSKGDFVARARVGPMRTPVGRYTNHALTPNACMLPTGDGGIEVRAVSEISTGEEITSNYRSNKTAAEAANKLL